MKVRPVGAEFFHASGGTDGQTRRSYSRFSQLCERA